MKVAIGYRVQDGPWGGGNRFARALADGLAARGERVVFDLADPDIDLMVLTDPRSRSPSVSFGAGACLRYLRRRPQALCVHRINECDERKGTRTMNRRLRLANLAADHTVFIASWLRELDLWRHGEWSVVLNGADPALFRADRNVPWDRKGPLRLVTHHWGGNRLKGFDVYEALDRLVATPTWKDRLAFTYVGNVPADARLTHSRVVPPLDGEALAAELASHHVYLTASINEPAGMHHIEGALSGLPLLYRESGALPEYCRSFGEAFTNPQDFHHVLGRMMQRYEAHKAAMPAYRHTTARMVAGYLDVFDDLMRRRDEIVAARAQRRDRLGWMLNQVPW